MLATRRRGGGRRALGVPASRHRRPGAGCRGLPYRSPDGPREVRDALRFHAFDLYGRRPVDQADPVEPVGYRDLSWAAHPEPVPDLEAVFRSRLRRTPKEPTRDRLSGDRLAVQRLAAGLGHLIPRLQRPYASRVIELRLTHPAVDFWVDVRLLETEGRWLAVADLASTPEMAVASRPDLAVLLALWPLGPALARRMAARAVLPGTAIHG